jgi:hypothetical protein
LTPLQSNYTIGVLKGTGVIWMAVI